MLIKKTILIWELLLLEFHDINAFNGKKSLLKLSYRNLANS